ncbi:type IV pilus modification protein PilV [Verminephrobacter eiseniae]|uniref:type IV pilus modification protein PilV n=1 Tax=Verminephrobacter eiseniae TaxID=364317 RepID=UPI0022372E5D|nr:type IV pilus modification protein PilV [Verminephrobacter eiseniae]
MAAVMMSDIGKPIDTNPPAHSAVLRPTVKPKASAVCRRQPARRHNLRHMMPRTSHRPGPSKGFSLLEVLVAIVILTFAILGTVGMQGYALQANREARLQAQAVMLANELAEMMRGNNAIAVQPKDSNPYMQQDASNYCLRVANASAGCSSTTEVAQAQMTDWLARVHADLPQAKVKVCFDGAPYDTESGLAKWDCDDAGDIAYIKIGWTRRSTNTGTGTTVAGFEKATDDGSRPYVIVPVTGGDPAPATGTTPAASTPVANAAPAAGRSTT